MTYFDTDLVRQFGLFSKVKKIDLVRHPPPAGGEGGVSVVCKREDVAAEGGHNFETDSDSDEQFSEDKDGL